MKITQVSKQKNNEERYNIYVDGAFCFSSSIEDVIKNNIKEGMDITEEQLDSFIEACEYGKAYNYALFLLNARNYTSKEIKNKLEKKFYSQQTINRVLDKLQSYGMINDEEYASKYINDSINFKKNGIRKIQYNLINKGISREIIDNIEVDYESQLKNALSLAEKKMKLLQNKSNPREKIYRFLISKGYDHGIVKKVIVRLYEKCECDD